jgi:hypothetical protein
MIIISDQIKYIQFNYGQTSYNLVKNGLEINRSEPYVNVSDSFNKLQLLYSDIYNPIFLSATALETQLLLWCNENYNNGSNFSISDRFAIFNSVAGQLTFTPETFSALPSSPVYVNGYLMVEGWSAVNGSIVFQTPNPVGSTVVIENNNNIIIEKTTQVFSATASQKIFTTLFVLSNNSKVYNNGLLLNYGIDWALINGNMVLTVACVGGETIIITK